MSDIETLRPYKVGETIIIPGEIRVDGQLVSVDPYTITATARRDGPQGPVLGSFARATTGLGTFSLTLGTEGMPPCQLYTDVKIVAPGGAIVRSHTIVIPLLPAVTA